MLILLVFMQVNIISYMLILLVFISITKQIEMKARGLLDVLFFS